MNKNLSKLVAGLFALGAIGQSMLAQETQPLEVEGDVLELEAFVMTAVTQPGLSKMKSSVSISSLNYDKVGTAVPRSTAEIFRNLPGFRAEATSGDGNANVTVRGLPLSAGGSRYVQFHEDGAPVLEFGDISFATADQFLRADAGLALVEAVRGGLSSTNASNSPGGIINFISKSGEVAGGSVSYTRGMDFDTDRVDFEYGTPISEDMRFHVSGFHRTGEGPRESGYNGNNGGQLKANFTKDFDNGYVRIYLKALDDSVITYLPMPTGVRGTAGNPTVGSVQNFDKLAGTPHSANFQSFLGIDGAGNTRTGDVSDGISVKDTTFGAEASFDLGDGWKLFDRLSVSEKSGRFISPFPATIDSAGAIANTVGGAGATMQYANGASAGQPYNGLVMRTVLFDTTLNNFDNFSNKLKLDKTFDLDDGGKITVGAGFYRAQQNISMDWLWNAYLLEVNGKNAALLDVKNAAGDLVTDTGLEAYSATPFGNFGRAYDTQYDIDAPFASLAYAKDKLNMDLSVRRDNGEARGAYFGVTTGTQDVDGNGVISTPETSVSVIDRANPIPVNYDWAYTSVSLGANYSIDDDTAVFVRYSEGGRAGADRIVDFLNADGSIKDAKLAYNSTEQFEAGVKYRTRDLVPGNLGLFATLFHAKTNEPSNFEVTTQQVIERQYKATGLELEFAYSLNNWDVRGGVTFTSAEISGADNLALIGNTPRRQADMVFQITPSYTTDRFTLGTTFIGTTDSYTQDDNDLKMPGYTYINAFARYNITQGLTVSLEVNNLTDTFGISESEEGSIPTSGIIRARGITGRTTSLTLKYSF